MPFPIKTCVICEEVFELRPDKPGYANRCPTCTADNGAAQDSGKSAVRSSGKSKMDADERQSQAEANEARRQAMRNLLYRKDS